MPNIYSAPEGESHGPSGSKVGREAGADQLGLSVYHLQPGEGVVFHYHLQREELLVVVAGTPSLRTAAGWRELQEGEVVSFPRGPDGAHGYENRSGQPATVLVFCEQNAPNVSVYPDTNEIGIFDAAHPENREFGARFQVADALSGYGGAQPHIEARDPSRE